MKTKQIKSNRLSKSNKELLKNAASKVGAKILFPKKVEDAKAYLKQTNFIAKSSVNK
jgi:hypothetical protein